MNNSNLVTKIDIILETKNNSPYRDGEAVKPDNNMKLKVSVHIVPSPMRLPKKVACITPIKCIEIRLQVRNVRCADPNTKM